MAGSPGAGKTEFSKRLLAPFEVGERKIVRIDPDDIRALIPSYIPGRAELFQAAVGIAVEKVHDAVLRRGQHFLLDGTSANLPKFESNIRRSLDKNRQAIVEYVYQDPLVAWEFTQKREALESRNIPKEAFLTQFFAAYENVCRVKESFGTTVTVDVIQRNIETGMYDVHFNVPTIAESLSLGYTREELTKRL